jgi:hypothetical protein
MEEEPPPAKERKAPPLREKEPRSISAGKAPPVSGKRAVITDSGHVAYLLQRARRVLKMRPHSRKRELARLKRVLIDVARVKLNTTLKSAPNQPEQAIDDAFDYVRDPVAVLADELPGLPYAIRSELDSIARAATAKKPGSGSGGKEVVGTSGKRPSIAKLDDLDPISKRIYKALLDIAKAKPKSHAEVFRMLADRKIPVPPDRAVFKSGWPKGDKVPQDARVWLSQAWGYLDLPPFRPGPKKKFQ